MDFVLPGEWNDVVTKLVASAIVLLIALVAYRILQIPVKRLLSAAEERGMGGSIFQNIVRVIVWGWAACAIADICFGVNMTGVLGALGVVGIAVSLGAQQTIANVIGGIIVSLSDTVKIGDWIVVQNSAEARVVDTSWRCTTLEDEKGIIYDVPNSVMVSSIEQKDPPFYTIVVPFALKPTVPDVEGLLVECEQVLLDRQMEQHCDFEQKRPKACVASTTPGAIHAEAKLYVDREFDTRAAKRAVLPALIDFLQERNALAELEIPQEQ